MKKENISSAGTIVTSLLASSCCIGPVIFVLFGTSAGFLSKLTFLDPLRPYLLGAAFVMLSYSFWKLYLRKKTIACACEADERSRKVARGIFWAGFGALVFAVSFQKAVLWIFG